ncbi:hypothetical protein SDC9_62931 [bioreactor metagenome]|uniref:OsmC-like protein n=1 Tax=bioreactor metagenome TaxID=1076179 RepID=A0A644XK32_9ZZZZ
MLTIMGLGAETHGYSIDGAVASVEKIMGTEPRRIVKIRINIDFPDFAYTEKHKKIIKAAAASCPVAQSLHPDLEQEIFFNFGKK